MLNLSEYRTKPTALSDHLPWAALVAPGVVLNKDGSFQRTLRFRGPDLESSTEAELVSVTARVNNALRRFGSGWSLFFEAARRPVADYPHDEFDCPAAWIVDEERRAAFEESGELFATHHYATLLWLPPAETEAKLTRLIIEDERGRETVEARSSLVDTFLEGTERAFALLADTLPEAEPLGDAETLSYLQSCLCGEGRSVRVPDVPLYLDAVLGGVAVTGGLAPTVNAEHLRVVSVLGLPNATEPGLLGALSGLGFPYRWTTRFIPLHREAAAKTLSRYRRQWFAKRRSVMSVLKEVMTNEASVLVDPEADDKARDAEAALQVLGGDAASFGYLTVSIEVRNRDSEVADARIAEIERVLGGLGFVTIREQLNALEAWLGTLPGHAYANVRQPLVHTLNLAHLMPLAAIWAGPEGNDHLDGSPLLVATTDANTPFRLVTHQGDVGHTLVVGPTGAGKSVLLSLMAMQFARYSHAQVYIFDKGHSALVPTLAMEGAHYELGTDGGIGFQPLRHADAASERDHMVGWLAFLLKGEGLDIPPERKAEIWSAVKALGGSPVEQRTLTGLRALVQDRDVAQALEPFTLDGPHGHLFDADNEEGIGPPWACFEMDALMQHERLVASALSHLFHRLERRFDGRPTLLLLDEAWLFLDHPTFAAQLREWLKTLRKKNVSVVFATQSLSDVANSSIAPAVIESCPTRIFLPNARAVEEGQAQGYRTFGLNARQVQLIARGTPKRDYYVQTPAGNRMFDLAMGEVALAFCGASAKPDIAAAKALAADLPWRDAFAAEWLRRRGFPWAADLVAQRYPHATQYKDNQGDYSCAAE